MEIYTWDRMALRHGPVIFDASADIRNKVEVLLNGTVVIMPGNELWVRPAGPLHQPTLDCRKSSGLKLINKLLQKTAPQPRPVRLFPKTLSVLLGPSASGLERDEIISQGLPEISPLLNDLEKELPQLTDSRSILSKRLEKMLLNRPVRGFEITFIQVLTQMLEDVRIMRLITSAPKSAAPCTIDMLARHLILHNKGQKSGRIVSVPLNGLLAMIPNSARCLPVTQFTQYGCDLGKQFEWDVKESIASCEFQLKRKNISLEDSKRPPIRVGTWDLAKDQNLQIDKGLARDAVSEMRKRLLGCPLLDNALQSEMEASGLPLKFESGNDELLIDYTIVTIPKTSNADYEERFIKFRVEWSGTRALVVRLHNAEEGIKTDHLLLARAQNYGGAGWVARIYWGEDRHRFGKTLDCYGFVHGEVSQPQPKKGVMADPSSGVMNDIHIPIEGNSPVFRPFLFPKT